MSKKITVRYNGNKVPLFGTVPVLPGINEIDEAQIMAHLNTPIGKAELNAKVWEIIEPETDKADGKEKGKSFFDLPVAKQKELVLENFNVAQLEELRDSKQINKSVKEAIIAQIAEILKPVEDEKKED